MNDLSRNRNFVGFLGRVISFEGHELMIFLQVKNLEVIAGKLFK